MSTSSQAFKRAFTLVELLVSIAVVALLMTAVITILTSATALTGQSRKHIDADNEARMVFDRMAADFSRMVNRTDVDYIFAKVSGASSVAGANDTFFFYSEAPALANTTTVSLQNTVALIGYNVNSSYQLQRLGAGLALGAAPPNGMVFLTYSPVMPTGPVTTNPPAPPGTAAFPSPNSNSTFANAAWQPLVGTASDTPPYSSYSTGTNSDYHILGPDVFRLEFCFLLKPQMQSTGAVLPAIYSNNPYDSRVGHTNLYGIGLQDVQAVVVAIAILDANSRKIVSAANLATLTAALTDSQQGPGPGSLQATPPVLMNQTWDGEISPANFSGALATVAPAVRIYQRTFYLGPFLSNP
jgi:prepilin-type N-terminal cleavage/methylation domain-containing protein